MSKSMRDMPAWGISLVVNLSILAIFHFIVYESRYRQDVNSITSVVDDKLTQEELNFADAVAMDQIGNEGASASLTPTLRSATAVGQNDTPLQEQVEEILNPDIPQLSEASMVKLEGDLAKSVEVKGQTDNTPGGVEGALDRVAFEIRQSLKERKTLVIWLFDASGSLKDRRETIANRFDNIYKQLGNLSGTQTEGLYSVVASYGQKAELFTPEPLQDISKLSEIVRKNIKNDESGLEYVFGATRLVLEKFKTWRRFEGPWNKMIFIVTDERGDDADDHLEQVIDLAKRSQTRVFCIGNAAVFGQQKGYYRYVFDDGYEVDIPIDQGPETAFPDGVQLPFIGSGQDWKLRQMSASYGPYALTRLCAETGGMYLITEESRGYNFDRSIMRAYAPDYRPVRLQEQEIRKNPAKTALVQVAGMTYENDLPVPSLTFRAYNDNILRTDIGEAQRPVAEIDYILKRMLDPLTASESSRGSIREPRWRAAYDLAMGRLMAMRVRYFGYNQMLANMKVSPKTFEKSNSNMWRLIPSEEIATGPQMRKAAEQAKEYLKRVIDEHPGTPWALLAEKEMSTPIGWSWQEFSEPIPGTNQLRANDEEVARLLLADEERRQEMRRQAEKPRVIPKL